MNKSHFMNQLRFQSLFFLLFDFKLFVLLKQLQSASSTKEMNAYSAAANVAEEVLSGIRTVFAFRGEKKEIDRYNNRLIIAKKAGERKGLLSGIEDGVMRFLFFGINALAFWYGVQLVLDDRDKIDKEYTPAVLMIVCHLH